MARPVHPVLGDGRLNEGGKWLLVLRLDIPSYGGVGQSCDIEAPPPQEKVKPLLAPKLPRRISGRSLDEMSEWPETGRDWLAFRK